MSSSAVVFDREILHYYGLAYRGDESVSNDFYLLCCSDLNAMRNKFKDK